MSFMNAGSRDRGVRPKAQAIAVFGQESLPVVALTLAAMTTLEARDVATGAVPGPADVPRNGAARGGDRLRAQRADPRRARVDRRRGLGVFNCSVFSASYCV